MNDEDFCALYAAYGRRLRAYVIRRDLRVAPPK
jgi:hypothetical protein